MENPAGQWAPRLALVALGWVLTAVLAIAALSTTLADDLPGALLFSIGGGFLLLLCAHASVVRPRLAADLTGVRIRALTQSYQIPWAEVTIQLKSTPRLGRNLPTLELESIDRFQVFGWLELGEDPVSVLAELDLLRTASSQSD